MNELQTLMGGTAGDRGAMALQLIKEFPSFACRLIQISAKAPADEMEDIRNLPVLLQVVALKAIWDVTVPDKEALDTLKNVVASLGDAAPNLPSSAQMNNGSTTRPPASSAQ